MVELKYKKYSEDPIYVTVSGILIEIERQKKENLQKIPVLHKGLGFFVLK